MTTHSDKCLLHKIEELRAQLVQAAKEKGCSLSDYSIVQLSQELDRYIVEFQTRHQKKASP